ncbi:MAG: adenine phosphoribosyltransferase [Gemmatimonas sp.]
MNDALNVRLEHELRIIPDFPKPGIRFRDITLLLANASLMREVIDAMSQPFAKRDVSHVVGVEARGFLFGVSIALQLNASFVPARKPGKLPAATVRESFALEYGRDALEMHTDALRHDSRVLVVDDILATGGTIAAACRLVERVGARVVGVSVLGAIAGLCEPGVLAGRDVRALVSL